MLVTAGAVTRPACWILGLRLMPPVLTQRACGLSGERWRSVASSQNSQIGGHKRLQQTKLVGKTGPYARSRDCVGRKGTRMHRSRSLWHVDGEFRTSCQTGKVDFPRNRPHSRVAHRGRAHVPNGLDSSTENPRVGTRRHIQESTDNGIAIGRLVIAWLSRDWQNIIQTMLGDLRANQF